MILAIREIRGNLSSCDTWSPLTRRQHGGASVNDVVGEAETGITDVFGSYAIIGHVKVQDVVVLIDGFQQFTVALGYCGPIIRDINSSVRVLTFDMEHGVEGEEDGEPEVVASGFHILGVFVTFFVGVELPVLLEGFFGVVNIAAGFAKGCDNGF